MPVIDTSTTLYGDRGNQWQVLGGQVNNGTTRKVVSRRGTIYRAGNWDRPRPDPLTPSPYLATFTRAWNPQGEHTGIKPNGWPETWVRHWGSFDGSFPSSWREPDETDRLRNEALLEMLSNLKDQKFNAGVAIAEARGTAQLATDIGKAIHAVRWDYVNNAPHHAYRKFRRKFGFISWSAFKRRYGQSLGRADLLAKVPSTWLYYHFGIKPTLMDLDDLHQDWFRRHAGKPENYEFLVRGQARHTVKRSGVAGFDIFDCNMKYVDSQSMRVYCTVRLKDGFAARMAQMGGTNFPEAAWNGLPYSWVVDYFTTFGDWLHALDAGMGYEFGTLVESYRRKVYADATSFWNDRNPSVPYGAARLSPYRYRSTELKRGLPDTFYPPMYRTLPSVKLGKPSIRQFANMLSALALSFGKGNSNVVKY